MLYPTYFLQLAHFHDTFSSTHHKIDVSDWVPCSSHPDQSKIEIQTLNREFANSSNLGDAQQCRPHTYTITCGHRHLPDMSQSWRLRAMPGMLLLLRSMFDWLPQGRH